MVVPIPAFNQDCWVLFAVEVLQAPKSWSNLMLNQEFQLTLCGIWIGELSQVKVRVVDQSSFRVLSTFVKPIQAATVLRFRKLLQVAVVDRRQEFVSKESGVP